MVFKNSLKMFFPPSPPVGKDGKGVSQAEGECTVHLNKVECYRIAVE